MSEQTTQSAPVDTDALESLQRLVQKVRRRVRIQVGLERATTGATVWLMLAMVALVLWKTSWIGFADFAVAAVALAAIPAAAFGSAWLEERSAVALAQRVDQSHELHDRLSTALALARDPSRDEFTSAQLRDALSFTERVDVSRAAPFSTPRDLSILVAFFVGFGLLSLLRPPSHAHPLPDPPVIKHDPVLDSATVAMEKEKVEEMKEELEGTDNPEAKRVVDEIEKLLEDVEKREISGKEFLERIKNIEKEHFETTKGDELEAPEQSVSEKLEEAAETLQKEAGEELKKEPELKETIEALEKNDMKSASKSLEKLANKLLDKDNIDPERLERLANLMDKFSKNLDVDKKKLQKMLEKHEDLAKKLSQKMKNQEGGLSQDEKRRLNRAKKKAEQLKQKLDGKKQSEQERQLERLQRKTKEAADEMKKASKEKKDGGDDQKKSDKKKKDDSDYQREAGRKMKEASKKMREQAKEQQSEKVKQMARKQLEELRRSMERSRPNRAQSKSGKGSESESSGDKGQKMREYLRKAQGSSDSDGSKKGKGKKSKSDSSKGRRRANRSGEKGGRKDQKKGDSKGGQKQDGKKVSDAAGDKPGGPALGEKTSSPDSKRKDTKVDGRKAGGPSRSKVIRTASEKGFANREYKEVYGDYSSVVEEVMEREDVPAGYRYYVKRYFELIKPRD